MTLKPDDFPDQQAALKDIQVSSVVLTYSLTGSEAVLKLLDRVPASIPDVIIRPEDQVITVKAKTIGQENMPLLQMKPTSKATHEKN